MVRRLTGIAIAGSVAFGGVSAIAIGTGVAQDARRGEHVFRKCILCHVTDPRAKDLVAPPLHDIIGRKAAGLSGFDYSDIMKTAGREGLTWTAEALFYFLDRPEEFMPGTYMAFSGLEEQERRDVIAYLERISAEWKRSEARQGRTMPSPGATDPAQRSPTKAANPTPK